MHPFVILILISLSFTLRISNHVYILLPLLIGRQKTIQGVVDVGKKEESLEYNQADYNLASGFWPRRCSGSLHLVVMTSFRIQSVNDISRNSRTDKRRTLEWKRERTGLSELAARHI